MITPLRLAAVAAATVAALGCVAAASHNVITTTPEASSSTAESVVLSSSDDDDRCSFVATPGYRHGDGDNSQVIQDNGHAYMGCGGGPTVSLEGVDGDTAIFELHGDRVRVREGGTDHIGPYRIHVTSVRDHRVELELSD